MIGAAGIRSSESEAYGWPRFEKRKEIHCRWHLRPVDDAVRIAFTERVGWIHTDYGSGSRMLTNGFRKVGKITSRDGGRSELRRELLLSRKKVFAPEKVKTL